MKIRVKLNNNNTLEYFRNPKCYYKQDSHTNPIKTLKYLFDHKCKKGIVRFSCPRTYREIYHPLHSNYLFKIQFGEEINYSIKSLNDFNLFDEYLTETLFSCKKEEWLQMEDTIQLMINDGFEIFISLSICMYNERNYRDDKEEKYEDDDICFQYNCCISVYHERLDFDCDLEPYLFSTLKELKDFIKDTLPNYFGEKYKDSMEFTKVILPSKKRFSKKKKK